MNVTLWIFVVGGAINIVTADSTNGPDLVRRQDGVPNKSALILLAGQSADLKTNMLRSQGDTVAFTMSRAGEPVIIRLCDNRVLWAPEIALRSDGQNATMQLDGNLVVSGPTGVTYWQTNTSGNSWADLRLQDDGFLCVYKDRHCVWSNGKHFNETSCYDWRNVRGQSHSAEVAKPRLRPSPAKSRVILASGISHNLALSPLRSPNGLVTLQLNSEGDVIMTECDGNDTILWKLPFQYDSDARNISMERNGNLVIYGTSGKAYWNSGTEGNPGADLRMEDDGLLCIRIEGYCLWSNGGGWDFTCRSTRTLASPGSKNAKMLLGSGQSINPNMISTKFQPQSANKAFSLRLNFVPAGYEKRVLLAVVRNCDNQSLWNKSGNGVVEKLEMNEDGNFLLYLKDPYSWNPSVHWQTKTEGNPGAVLQLEDDGNLCVNHNGTCIWSSGKKFVPFCDSDDE